jgi:hypothetical protein
MLNFGLGSVSTAAHRQQRMLRTIGQNLRLIEAGNGCETRDVVVPTRNCDHEALLTAIVLQGVVVAGTTQRPHPDGGATVRHG